MGRSWETAPLGPGDVGNYTTSLPDGKRRFRSRQLGLFGPARLWKAARRSRAQDSAPREVAAEFAVAGALWKTCCRSVISPADCLGCQKKLADSPLPTRAAAAG